MSAFNDLRLFRIYEPHELGGDGYPHVWHNIPGLDYGVKHLVRDEAGYRCERCKHPYEPGVGEWGESVDESPEPPPSGLLELFEERDIDVPSQMKSRPPLWSPCAPDCRHDVGLDEKGRPLVRWRNRVGDWTSAPLNIEPDAEQQASWRVLTVHHLNGRKHDLRWWNLIAACQRCHLWLQQTVIMERVYPWEHDDYFKVHAAGWYAYAYRGENLTRLQTMMRLDDLLALERAA